MTCEFQKLKFDTKVGVVITDQMDREIDRILPLFKEKYPLVREQRRAVPYEVGTLQFVHPYSGGEWAATLFIDYDDDKDAGWGWARRVRVGINAALYEEIKDYEYRRVLAHELIHVVDPTLRPYLDDYYRPSDGRDKYLTQECECHAFSGMMTYSLRKNAKTWKGTEHHDSWIKGLAETYDVLPDPVTYIEKHHKAGVFDRYYASVLHEYKQLLSLERYEVFAGRICLALDDGIAHLEGKTVSPFPELIPLDMAA